MREFCLKDFKGSSYITLLTCYKIFLGEINGYLKIKKETQNAGF